MNKLTKCLSSVMKKFDLFPASQYLRYKQEAEYKTAAGGFISITVIVICLILFYSLGVQTLNKSIIYGLTTKNIQVEPDSLKINFGNASTFMFCFGIQNVNVSDTSKKYFNITLKQNFYGPLEFYLINSTTVPLVPCTPEHFSYNADTRSFYQKFYLSQALCPSMDYQFTIGGRLISDVYSYFSVHIDYCNQTIDPKCASEAQVLTLQNKIGGFNFYSPIINTIVNPGDAEYKQVYVEERNYYFFTTKSGVWLNAQIQEYQIDTDVSLMPYSDIQTEKVTAIPQLFLVKSRQTFGGRYVEMIFSKSSTSTIFTRSFNKVDNYFSYIGGLVGTLLLFFFLLGSYSETSFVVSIASQIFHFHDQGQPQTEKTFNFINYLSLSFYSLLKMIQIKPKEGETLKLIGVIEQMQKQLDIAYLLKRVTFCEEAVTSILDEHQIKALYLKGKKTIKQATLERKKIKKQQKISEKMLNLNNPFDFKQKDSSINNLLDSQIQQNKLTLNFDQQPSKFENQESVNQSESNPNQSQSHKQDTSKTVKQILTNIVNNSNEGNQISRRILKKLNKKIFPQIGLISNDNEQGKVENYSFKQQKNILENFDFQIKE